MLELPDNPVEATLQLVIEQLDEGSRQLLPRLSVFQGGALEDVLLDITEISIEKWGKLRSALISTGLMQAENVYGQTYLQFHPSLTTALHSDNQENLRHHHQRCYYELSSKLYFADEQNPRETFVIVKRELANLLFAVKGTLAKPTDYVVDFVSNMNLFLNFFELQRDLEQLNQQVIKLAEEVGSEQWLTVQFHRGQQLSVQGQYQQAIQVFQTLLEELGKK
jgi:hypothetical protein